MPFETTTVELEPGNLLALYTDGLVRRFPPDPYVGLRHLADRPAAFSGRDSRLIDVGRSMLADAVAPPRDDIALLLARVRALAEDTTAYWEFPAVADRSASHSQREPGLRSPEPAPSVPARSPRHQAP